MWTHYVVNVRKYLSWYRTINDSFNNDALTLKEMLLAFVVYFGRKRRKKRAARCARIFIIIFCIHCPVSAFIKWWWCINAVDNIIDFFLRLFYLYFPLSLLPNWNMRGFKDLLFRLFILLANDWFYLQKREKKLR